MWPEIIGGALGLAGSIFGSASTAKGQREVNESNLQIAREQMAFQERMDNTKYQRGVEDARKAGFNPLVAFPGHGGSPIGASAVLQNPSPNKGELYLSTAKTISDLILTQAQAKREREVAETQKTEQQLNRKQMDAMQAQIDAMSGQIADAKNRRDYASNTVGKAMSWVKNVGSDIGAVGGALLGFGASSASQLARSSRVIKGFSK